MSVNQRWSANRGEWSELYVLFKLLADGILYGADENLNKKTGIFYKVLEATRKETDTERKYVRDASNLGNVKIISENAQNPIIIPISSFVYFADKLFEKIIDGGDIKVSEQERNGAFTIPEIRKFAEEIGCTSIKASAAEKEDITLVVHDSQTDLTPTLGFSIKSTLGSPSSLLNASRATNFIYTLGEHIMTEEEITEFNQKTKFRNKLKYLEDLGVTMSFKGMQSKIFRGNLMLVDTKMPEILGEMLQCFYRGKGTTVKELTKLSIEKNLCDVCGVDSEQAEHFYTHKIKEFLTDVALGMTPASRWDGKYWATGGYIIVTEKNGKGEALCFHIYNRNDFRDYLYNNTKFDTPSSTRHNFGKIEVQDNNQQIIKLNLQIRFIQ